MTHRRSVGIIDVPCGPERKFSAHTNVDDT
jgi:hypothetical protein